MTGSGWSARAIAASIERSVHDGRVQPSEALVPVRTLATRLKVSPATVAAAYRLLRARGLTAAQGRRGTRVIARPPGGHRAAPATIPAGAVDLASGNPDPALLPSLETALRSIDASPRRYDDPPHLPALVAFARAELKADGIPTGSLTMTSGGLDAIERVLREHVRPGDRVAVEDPCFPAVHDLLLASGFVQVPFAVDAEGPITASLERALQRDCRAVLVTVRGQNPTGSAVSGARASELRRLLRRHPDLLVVESDPCGPVAGVPLNTLAESSRNRWVHIAPVSKFLGPDMRLAFVAGDPLTIARVEGRHALGPRRVSYLLQRLALALWSDPSAGRQLARASEIYATRRAALLDALAARGIEAHGSSGLHAWVPLRHEGTVVQHLRERGWVVAAGEPFRIEAPPGIRVTIACLRSGDALHFADHLAEACASLQGPSA
jgi:DNA-binding transcriptional MocR family regulator